MTLLRRGVLASAIAAAFACVTFGGGFVHAEGGPPMLTDDPGTPGDGHWEINLAWTSQRASSSHQDEFPLADINYGSGDRLQLKFEMPWIVESGGANNGFGSALIGVKWRFVDQGEDGWQVSTYPQVGFRPPGLHRAASDPFTPGRLLPLEVQRDFGGFDAGFEIGREWAVPDGGDGWIAGVDAGHKFSDRFELIGELHDETVGGEGAHELAFNVGARQTLSGHLTLLASLGTDLDNTIGPRNRWLSYLGLQLTP